MDVRDFQIMIQKHAPWLLDWIKRRTSQFKLQNQTDEGFETIVAMKVESIKETPWKDLSLEQETNPTTDRITEGGRDGFLVTSRFYTIIWRKNNQEKIRHTGTQKMAGLSVSKLLKLVLSECEAGDTPWVVAVVETVYTINTASTKSPQHNFIVYPCEERAFMEWVDRNTEEINRVLAQRGLTLSGYTVVAQSN